MKVNNKLKKLFIMGILLILLTACSKIGVGKSSEKGSDYSIAMVLDIAGVDDRALNASAWKGLSDYGKETGKDISLFEASSEEDYPYLINGALRKNPMTLMACGPALAKSAEDGAKQNPETKFFVLDYVFGNENAASKLDVLKNLTGVGFKVEEAAYLMGYMAGLTTKNMRVGFVGSIKGYINDAYEYGFRAGIHDASKEMGKEIILKVEYVNSFSDVEAAKTVAKKMFESGIDIVYSSSPALAIGTIEAAVEADKLAIGVDSDQSHLAPKNVLSSSVKKMDFVVKDISKKMYIGQDLMGKNLIYGIKEEGLAIAEYKDNESLVTRQVYDKTMAKQRDLAAGKKIIPFDKETWDNYKNK